MASRTGQGRSRLSLAWRFLLGSLLILCAGMAGIGIWVARQIETGVVHRTAATTAVYVDSLIAAPLQEVATRDSLSPAGSDELDRLLRETPLGQAVALFRVWDRQGRIIYSTMPAQVGQVFPIKGELAEAEAGKVSADIGTIETEGVAIPASSHDDLLEIYSPVRDRTTNQVIAVAEFYYAANDLNGEIAAARRRSWLVVGGGGAAIYLVLAIFVQRANNVIVGQGRELAGQVDRLTDLLRQNEELDLRVREAAARTTALNERFLRRFSAELHDGPAQDISLALLQLDHLFARLSGDESAAALPGATADSIRDLELIRTSLQRALHDVRATSSGLLLPELDKLTVAQTVEHAVRAHQRRSGIEVDTEVRDLPSQAPIATKIALYRIVQEALANGWRHAGGKAQRVHVTARDGTIRLEIADGGTGFDISTIGGSASHLGLVGMRERVVSLGGTFRIESGPARGTRIVAYLPRDPIGERHG